MATPVHALLEIYACARVWMQLWGLIVQAIMILQILEPLSFPMGINVPEVLAHRAAAPCLLHMRGSAPAAKLQLMLLLWRQTVHILEPPRA